MFLLQSLFSLEFLVLLFLPALIATCKGEIFAWHEDGSCGDVQQKLIRTAFEDAMAMARSAIPTMNHSYTLEAALDIFGPQVMYQLGERTVFSVFSNVAAGVWNLVSRCDIKNASKQCKCDLQNPDKPCAEPYAYGGIYSTSSYSNAGGANKRDHAHNVDMVFCRDFFLRPPYALQTSQVMNNATHWWVRYHLGAFHQNQGLSLHSSR